ncbi:MAG: hypothetical protein H6618_03265 [Deltaproteobacteria bacterium]|nr:hypothetical protein [Deltaproteobacteria bacterium]
MAAVELRPGDTLNIIWSGVQETPLGSTEIETMFSFTYEELLQKLRAKGAAGKVTASGSEGVRMSRFVALSAHALKKGRWSTGAPIDKDEVFNRMLQKLSELAPEEYDHVTRNARFALKELCNHRSILRQTQKQSLKKALEAMGFALD